MQKWTKVQQSHRGQCQIAAIYASRRIKTQQLFVFGQFIQVQKHKCIFRVCQQTLWNVAHWAFLPKRTFHFSFFSPFLLKSNFAMSLKPFRSQTSHGHIHPVQRISVRSGLSQYPFVNLVGKSLCTGMLVLRVRTLKKKRKGKKCTQWDTQTKWVFPHTFTIRKLREKAKMGQYIFLPEGGENISPNVALVFAASHSSSCVVMLWGLG